MRTPAGLGFGFRLIALSVVASSGVLLPAPLLSRLLLVAGILIGVLLGAAQYFCARWRWRVPGECFVLAYLAIWTVLVHASDGRYSPLFIGYVLEIPLAAALLGRRGMWFAAGAGLVAYLASGALLHPPLDLAVAAAAVGLLAIATTLSWITVGVLERQQRAIQDSHAALQTRARDLAEELRLLGDYLDDVLVIIDDLGRVTTLNHVGLALLGLERDEALGRPWQEVLKPDGAGTGAITRTLTEAVYQPRVEMVLEGPKGNRIPVCAELWAGSSVQGRRTYVLFGAGPRTADEADPLRRLGEAAACVSHQIKNSIHALQGMVFRVIQNDPAAESRRSVRELREALCGLGSLAGDMLALSGAPHHDRETVRMNEALASAMILAQGSVGEAQVGNDGRQALVRANRAELVHALFNLLDNAGRVSPPGAPVRVRLRADRTHVYADIEDSGPGLPPGLHGMRSRAPTRTGSGYGLLAARRFLEANGGTLWFEPISAGGTRCRVQLPRAPEAERPASAAAPHARRSN